MLHTCCVFFILQLQPNPLQTSPQPSPGAPGRLSHLLGAHQEANHLASVGGGIAVGVGARGARGAVRCQAGQVIVGAVVLGQLAKVLQSSLAAQLKGEQRLELYAFDGAQQNH